ncbi:KAP family NTPase [Prevotella copri]|uniref:KAP P-loop protein n=1 Tax=Segatella copri TaxID=165179 RepID=A0AA90VL04_9BACT|nr:P-loop NTPase fold protein [Segatella copri]MBV3444995.1 KAP family NTPase [Segatella copri]MQO91294.1 KAP P-loop protein [Segatella copri]
MWKDIETAEDLLGYRFHAKLLKDIVLDDNMLPTSIGIFGNWGYGKSSLMLLMQKEVDIEIAKQNNAGKDWRVLQVRFNGWQYENYESTKYSLIQVLLDSVESYLSANKDFFEKLDGLLRRINLLKVGVLLFKKYTWSQIPSEIKDHLPSSDELKKCIDVDNIDKFRAEFVNDRTSLFVTSFRKLFGSIIKDAQFKSVIVYIDDLDRCSGERMIECIEAIKLFLNVDHTAFVLGADERMVELAIKEHYPVQDRNKSVIYSPFSDYLEKLIQIPYRLPKLSFGEQATYIMFLLLKSKYPNYFDGVLANYYEFKDKEPFKVYTYKQFKQDLNGRNIPDVEKLLEIVPMMNRFLNGTPRQLKRFLNTFDLRLRMVKVASMREINEIILAKLMLLEYNFKYQKLFESLYGMQQTNQGTIKDIDKVESNARQNKNLGDKRWEEWADDKLVWEWLKVEPSLMGVNLAPYFWIARDSLKNSVPVENLVSNSVRLLFQNLLHKQSARVVKSVLQEEMVKFDETERQMLILLLNQELIKDPNNKQVVQLFQADESNLVVQTEEDCNLLFDNINTLVLSPSWGVILEKRKTVDAWKKFIETRTFDEKVKRLI